MVSLGTEAVQIARVTMGSGARKKMSWCIGKGTVGAIQTGPVSKGLYSL